MALLIQSKSNLTATGPEALLNQFLCFEQLEPLEQINLKQKNLFNNIYEE